MPIKPTVSLSVIRRLPRYYRFLGELKREGINRISSRELAERMGVTASQIRQDLNCFGGFGQQGYGYNILFLHEEIGNILGLNHHHRTVLIGAGNLGKAIALLNFEQSGFHLCGVFDRSPSVIGTKIAGITVEDIDHLTAFCQTNQPSTALLCVPRTAADSVSKTLIKNGVRAFLNFSHYDIALHNDNVTVENVHLLDSLMTLGYRMNEKKQAMLNNT